MAINTNRIKEWRLKKSWTLQTLADAIGTSKSQIDKLEKGERRLTIDWMLRLAGALECEPLDLVTNEDTAKNKPAPTQSIYDLIPVRSAARGGCEQEMFLQDGPIDQVMRPACLSNVKDAYAIYVVGDSMSPMYRPGQLLFVNPFRPATKGRGVVITKTNSAVLIKEFVRSDNNHVTLKEYQPEIREFSIPLVEIKDIHVVTGSQEP